MDPQVPIPLFLIGWVINGNPPQILSKTFEKHEIDLSKEEIIAKVNDCT
jgi:hypothetical protein